MAIMFMICEASVAASKVWSGVVAIVFQEALVCELCSVIITKIKIIILSF